MEFTEDQIENMSPEIRDLILKMLIKDPSQRITLAEIKVFTIRMIDIKCRGNLLASTASDFTKEYFSFRIMTGSLDVDCIN